MCIMRISPRFFFSFVLFSRSWGTRGKRQWVGRGGQLRGVRLMINLFHFSHFGAHYCVGFFFPLNVCGIKALFFHLLYFQGATRDRQTEEQRRNVGFQTRAPCGEQLSESVVIDAPAYGENVEAGFWWHIKFDARIEKIAMGFRNTVRDVPQTKSDRFFSMVYILYSLRLLQVDDTQCVYLTVFTARV